MAFDEEGQADTYERRIEICKRSYDILVNKVSFLLKILFSIQIFFQWLQEWKNIVKMPLIFLKLQVGYEKIYRMQM